MTKKKRNKKYNPNGGSMTPEQVINRGNWSKFVIADKFAKLVDSSKKKDD